MTVTIPAYIQDRAINITYEHRHERSWWDRVLGRVGVCHYCQTVWPCYQIEWAQGVFNGQWPAGSWWPVREGDE